MKIFPTLLPFVCALAITACGGSSDTSDSTVTDTILATESSTDIDASAGTDSGSNAESVLTGRFVDSPVSGLQYATASQSGVTASDGSYNYLAGEQVVFSIGDIVFPATAAIATVTPLNVFSTTNIADTRVINMARLLQSLDIDANPDNGITISPEAEASATGLSVDFASTAFDSQVINLVGNSGSSNTSLIGGEPALDHFQETLFQEGIEERPTAADNTVSVDTSSNSATNPLVGTTAEFTTLFHDVAGTLTLLDDRTIQITNFTYDGDGPSVYFYTGTDGGYDPSQGGRRFGPRLNGRPYNNETLTITLPDDITLDDFNGISVWCDLFFANFGDARF